MLNICKDFELWSNERFAFVFLQDANNGPKQAGFKQFLAKHSKSFMTF